MDRKSRNGPRRRWTKDQQRELLGRARALIAEGETWNSAAKALGIWPSSLRRWDETYGAGFREVVVEAAPVVATALSMTTPDGFRVEGLDVDGAFLLMEMLRCSG